MALGIDPSNAATWHDIGLVLHQLGRYSVAIGYYKRAIAMDPTDADYYTSRGQTYNSLSDHDAVVADYTRAIGLEPANAYAYRGRAISHFFRLDIPAAENDLRAAVALNASDSYALELLGWVLYFQEDWAGAYSVYQQLQAVTTTYILDDTAARITELAAAFGPTPTPEPLRDALFAAGEVVTVPGRGVIALRDAPNGMGPNIVCTSGTPATVQTTVAATNGTRWVQLECDGGMGWLSEAELGTP